MSRGTPEDGSDRASGSRTPPTVLFIAGSFRSGSTILDNTLGQIEGVCSVGELRALWENGLLAGRTCGCGSNVRECEFWRGVLRAAFGAEPPDPREVVALQSEFLRTRPFKLYRLMRASHGRVPAGVRRYLAIVRRMYCAVAEVADARIVVDSSKVPADAYALATQLDLDVRVLHLVRDPRAVAFSWSRRKQAPDDPNRETMEAWGPVKSSARWLVWNEVLEHLVRRAAGSYLQVRYEDFAEAPREVVHQICGFVGVGPPELGFDEGGRLPMKPTHGPSGNPDRLDRGRVEITPDEEWREAMTRGSRILATLPAVPLLARYGYLGASEP